MSARRAFVVQFAGDADPSHGQFAGRVEHVSSGQTMHFHSESELLAFFARVLAQEQTPPTEDQ